MSFLGCLYLDIRYATQRTHPDMLLSHCLRLLALWVVTKCSVGFAVSNAEPDSRKLTHVELGPYLNNKAAAPGGKLAGFNLGNESYPAEYLPTGIFNDAGFTVRACLCHLPGFRLFSSLPHL
jgi:hypothetical protein